THKCTCSCPLQMVQYFSQVQKASALSHCWQTTGPRTMNASTKTVPERLAEGQGAVRMRGASRSPCRGVHFLESSASAIASSLVTLFQLRPVPGAVQIFSSFPQGSFDFPMPLEK